MGIRSTNQRILYVDDAAFYRKAISMLLSKNNFDVDTATNGLQALQMLEEKEYDLVVTDFEMPLMSGLELLLLLRHQYSKKELPVITLTRNRDQETIQNFIQAGTSAYVVKQNDLNPLLKKVQELISKTAK
jgi:CheY-like chemotaxis protein